MRKTFLPYGLHEITEDDIKEVIKSLKSGWLTTGPKVEEFEKKISDYVNAKYAVAVNSGTSALDIAVGCLGIEPGSEVITTPLTFAASSNCLLYNHLKPVFVDIQKDTFNIDPSAIKKAVTNKTRAIVFVDFAGHPCDIDEIKEIADRHDLYTIEDSSHAFGAEYRGKKLGSFADITVFSFHPVKHIATGEGGLAATDNPKLAETMRLLRSHGIEKNISKKMPWLNDMRILGRNYRITDFQCALGISQLKRIEEIIGKREKIARIYDNELRGIKEVSSPKSRKYVKHAWHIYPILLDEGLDRNKFIRLMRGQNIGADVHYMPVYKFTYYKKFNINPLDFPITEDVFARTVTLPIFPGMTEDDAADVVEAVKVSLKKL